MDSSIIAVRVANGSYVPVMKTSGKTRRRLVLTTIRDDQTDVQIGLYRAQDESMENPEYVGSLMIESIEAAPKGEADIALLLGVDQNGNLNATATDKKSGEYQSLSVAIAPAESGADYDMPDFELSDEELTLEDLSMDEDEIELDDSADSLSLDDVTLEEDLDLDSSESTDTLAASPEGEEVSAGLGDLDDIDFGEDFGSDDAPQPSGDDELSFDDLGAEDLSIEDTEASSSTEISEELGGLEGFSDEAVALDESLSEEVEEVSAEETEAEFATDDLSDSEELPDIDDGMVEADLGDEDFTFDEPAEFDENAFADETPLEESMSEDSIGEEIVATDSLSEENIFDESALNESAMDTPSTDESEAEFGSDDSDFDSDDSDDFGGFEDDLQPDDFGAIEPRTEEAVVPGEFGAAAPPLVPRRSNGILFVGYLILSLAAVGVLTYLVFRLLEGPPAPPLRAALPVFLAAFPARRPGRRRRKNR